MPRHPREKAALHRAQMPIIAQPFVKRCANKRLRSPTKEALIHRITFAYPCKVLFPRDPKFAAVSDIREHIFHIFRMLIRILHRPRHTENISRGKPTQIFDEPGEHICLRQFNVLVRINNILRLYLIRHGIERTAARRKFLPPVVDPDQLIFDILLF